MVAHLARRLWHWNDLQAPLAQRPDLPPELPEERCV
jgi:hypothetical protein